MRKHRVFDKGLHHLAEFGEHLSRSVAGRAGFDAVLSVALRTRHEQPRLAIDVLVYFAADLDEAASVEVEAILTDALAESVLLSLFERLFWLVFLAAVIAKTPRKIEPMIGDGALHHGLGCGWLEGFQIGGESCHG